MQYISIIIVYIQYDAYICIVELNYTAKVNRSTPQNNVKIYKKDWNNQIRKGEIVRQ